MSTPRPGISWNEYDIFGNICWEWWYSWDDENDDEVWWWCSHLFWHDDFRGSCRWCPSQVTDYITTRSGKFGTTQIGAKYLIYMTTKLFTSSRVWHGYFRGAVFVLLFRILCPEMIHITRKWPSQVHTLEELGTTQKWRKIYDNDDDNDVRRQKWVRLSQA